MEVIQQLVSKLGVEESQVEVYARLIFKQAKIKTRRGKGLAIAKG
jgi:predicted DNA-binding transcriptional regulator